MRYPSTHICTDLRRIVLLGDHLEQARKEDPRSNPELQIDVLISRAAIGCPRRTERDVLFTISGSQPNSRCHPSSPAGRRDIASRSSRPTSLLAWRLVACTVRPLTQGTVAGSIISHLPIFGSLRRAGSTQRAAGPPLANSVVDVSRSRHATTEHVGVSDIARRSSLTITKHILGWYLA